MPKGDPGDKLKRVDLSQVDVEEFLKALNIQNITHADADMRFSCPYTESHSFGDTNPSAYMNKDTTAFICFSCTRTGNAVTLLADMMNVSRTQARTWIAQKWSAHFVAIDNFADVMKRILESHDEADVDQDQVLDESNLTARLPDWFAAHQHFMTGLGEGSLGYMFDRGFTPEILTHFQVCYDPISDRPCVSVRNEYGQLVGFKGRAWREDQIPKYMVVGDTERGVALYGHRYGFEPYDASRYVFGLDKAAAIDGAYIFREGELNVVSMHQKGFTNTIGPSGSTVTIEQIEKIVARRDCERVIVFMDYDLRDDVSAAMAQAKIFKIVDLFEPYVPVFIVGRHDGDPNVMTAEEIDDLVKNTTSSTTHRLAQALGIATSS